MLKLKKRRKSLQCGPGRDDPGWIIFLYLYAHYIHKNGSFHIVRPLVSLPDEEILKVMWGPGHMFVVARDSGMTRVTHMSHVEANSIQMEHVLAFPRLVLYDLV